ncbi:ubiquitin-conjugating enzyme E2, putative [Rhizoctonia solani AG-3 Rhs1AP]|uniref:Ubiquitin-conjugating enzyme E2, putative n=2 Tax=Rhizoctonia solani AG-3 TaxID=1086053 RepID=X8IWJ0_9AGAM|nr:ubiquitin-conjugating enzyme E2, putative [Rhizoctonia solani AG-3 Rhs1AP]KEP48280.1 putative ubiquitin-conjugating enzyme E2 [Rhizoctonia solani 123E]
MSTPTPSFTPSGSKPGTPGAGPQLLLRRQLQELTKRPVEGFSAGLVDDSNIMEWEVMIIGQVHVTSRYPVGGVFRARLKFPENFPLYPPEMRFLTTMWHPNIYPDGRVCISILHAPGEDQYGFEQAGERWMPVHTVESILLSVISLLSSETPNIDSPANVDAAVSTSVVISSFGSFRMWIIRSKFVTILPRTARKSEGSPARLQRKPTTSVGYPFLLISVNWNSGLNPLSITLCS